MAGWGCSSRNGGQVSNSLKPDYQKLSKRAGQETARGILNEGLNALKYLDQFIHDEGIDCDWQRCGRFMGAHNKFQFEQLRVKASKGSNDLELPLCESGRIRAVPFLLCFITLLSCVFYSLLDLSLLASYFPPAPLVYKYIYIYIEQYTFKGLAPAAGPFFALWNPRNCSGLQGCVVLLTLSLTRERSCIYWKPLRHVWFGSAHILCLKTYENQRFWKVED